MKTYIGITVIALLTVSSYAEARRWTTTGGETLEAEYVRRVFDDVILKSPEGQETRIPISKLSDADREYLTLANPPKFSVDFLRSSKQEHTDTSPFLRGLPPKVLHYQFGARIKQPGADYPYPVTIEVYAFSNQRYDPSKYHLIAKEVSQPVIIQEHKENKYEFEGKNSVQLLSYQIEVKWLGWRQDRGEEFAEMLALVRDQRGEIIAYNTTKNWLYDNFDKLSELPVGAWLNDECIRVHPTVADDVRSGTPYY
jgi:hypothetical protein